MRNKFTKFIFMNQNISKVKNESPKKNNQLEFKSYKR